MLLVCHVIKSGRMIKGPGNYNDKIHFPVGYYPDKFGCHRYCSNGDIIPLAYQSSTKIK